MASPTEEAVTVPAPSMGAMTVTEPQAIPVHSALPEAANSNSNLPGTSSGPSESSSNLPGELPPAAAPGPVQMAQVISKAAQEEMRIGLSTSAFGSVEVRTVIHASDVGMVIGSEKGDLRSLLATEIPGITSTLQQQNLRLAQVSFQPTGFAFSRDSSGGNSQPRHFTGRPDSGSGAPVEPACADPVSIPESPMISGGRLSILA